MRWSFLLLLVLNLFYFVWHQQQAPMVAKDIVALPSLRGEQQNIRLLSESKSPPARKDAEALSASSQSHAVAAPESCLFLGVYQQESDARAVEQRLISLDIHSRIQPLEAVAGTDYWVYLAPVASRQASLRQLKELQARRIDSYLITQGDLANGISLGIFPQRDSAESVMQRLREAGYEPLLRELSRAQRMYWVRVENESRRLVDDALLQRLAVDYKDLQHQIMPCESIATQD
jgi:cell division septation protein DedD